MPQSKPLSLTKTTHRIRSPTKTTHRIRSPTKTIHRSRMSNKDHILTRQKNFDWCFRHFPKFWSEEIWPPSFPDLNPMDFCVWSYLETKACSVAHTSVEALKLSLMLEWAKLPQEHYRAAVDEFQRRLDIVFDVKAILNWFLCIFSIILYNFFVIYAYFELFIKQNRSPKTFCPPCAYVAVGCLRTFLFQSELTVTI